MRAPLIVITGTGTEIGKTHVGSAILRAWGARARVAGLKPIETGIPAGGEGEDARRLREASTFHVKPWPDAPYRFLDPVSPHLAARAEGRRIESSVIRAFCETIRDRADGVLVELAGGLFSPVTDTLLNIDVAKELSADRIYLVAPDRLGVLHDLAATTRAAAAAGLSLNGVLLSAPATRDSSTGKNAAEIRIATRVPLIANLPRASSEDLARDPALNRLAEELVSLRRGE